DGVMTASFHTSNDDATKLLSHSLSQLKQVLESQGVSVERLQVSQTPKEQQARNDDPREQPRDQQDDAHRQEQQRKDMLRRMWRRLSNGSDPLDLVA
ncbi:MAG: flagellar hook-length control protein FliK, partial [Planctomycetota bacterium]|nr:flagellar hook-length control protein FliK [Planctomycetota bacterium]